MRRTDHRSKKRIRREHQKRGTEDMNKMGEQKKETEEKEQIGGAEEKKGRQELLF